MNAESSNERVSYPNEQCPAFLAQVFREKKKKGKKCSARSKSFTGFPSLMKLRECSREKNTIVY
jgi:hypothetical protein